MKDDLVEAVARAIERSLVTARLQPGTMHPYTAEARAAITAARPAIRTEALEEARDALADEDERHAQVIIEELMEKKDGK